MKSRLLIRLKWAAQRAKNPVSVANRKVFVNPEFFCTVEI